MHRTRQMPSRYEGSRGLIDLYTLKPITNIKTVNLFKINNWCKTTQSTNSVTDLLCAKGFCESGLLSPLELKIQPEFDHSQHALFAVNKLNKLSHNIKWVGPLNFIC